MSDTNEIYVATDIESDGPCPGHYSMLSFASVAFRLDKTVLSTLERNLDTLPGAKQHPDHMKFWSDNPDAWSACRKDTVCPAEAMRDYTGWIKSLPGTAVFVAHPISFDHLFIRWYLYEFVGEDPFFLAGLDMASYAMALMRSPYTKSHKPHMPESWNDPDTKHTHVALDDAIGHAMTFCNMVAANPIVP